MLPSGKYLVDHQFMPLKEVYSKRMDFPQAGNAISVASAPPGLSELARFGTGAPQGQSGLELT